MWQRWGIMMPDVGGRQENVLSELLYYRTSVKVMISYVTGSLCVETVFVWETSWKENDKVINLTPGGETPVQTTSLPEDNSLLRILAIVSLKNKTKLWFQMNSFSKIHVLYPSFGPDLEHMLFRCTLLFPVLSWALL